MQKTASKEKNRLDIDKNGLEYTKWKTGAAFPVSAGICNMSSYCNNAFDFHWHDGPELSVTDTALASGFSSSSYYTEVFRRYMGCAPREYLRHKKR